MRRITCVLVALLLATGSLTVTAQQWQPAHVRLATQRTKEVSPTCGSDASLPASKGGQYVLPWLV